MVIGQDTVVLLGAGASAEAGVPTTRKMTVELAKRISGENWHRRDRVASALNFVCGALIAHDAAHGNDPFEEPDVERVFAAVEMLAERRTLEVSPFVDAWDPGVDAWDDLTRPRPENFARQFRRALESGNDSELTNFLQSLGGSEFGPSRVGTTYTFLGHQMLEKLRELVELTEKKVDYLRPLVSRGRQNGGLTIATLNYDRGIELAAAAEQVPVETGIASWLESRQWEWPAHGVRLLKLHGSIDWFWSRAEAEEGELPHDVVQIGTSDQLYPRPALVFGNRGKLRAEGPFLGLLAEFGKLLERASRLIVIGYSFRDDHVNEGIRQWLSEARQRKIVVIDPHWPDGYEAPITPFQSDLLHYLVPRETDGGADFEPRLKICPEACGEALARLTG
jgi:NAD-dependent SIR2 family protein deacetylase